WETSIPVVGALGLGYAGEIRHQRAVSEKPLHWHNRMHLKAISALDKAEAGINDIIRQDEFGTWFELKVLGQPLVGDDFVITHLRRNEAPVGGCYHRIRRSPVAGLNEIGEISDDAYWLGSGLTRLNGRGDYFGVEKNPRAGELD